MDPIRILVVDDHTLFRKAAAGRFRGIEIQMRVEPDHTDGLGSTSTDGPDGGVAIAGEHQRKRTTWRPVPDALSYLALQVKCGGDFSRKAI